VTEYRRTKLIASRRTIIAGAIASALFGGRTATAAPSVVANWRDTVDAHIRVRADKDGGRAVYFVTGDIWARRAGSVAEKLFTVEACTFNRLTRTVDGNLEHVSSELGSFKDVKTGKYLREWKNPYNNEICEAPLIGRDGMVGRVVLTPTGIPEGLSSGVRGDFLLGAPSIQNGTMWLTDDTAVLIPRPVPGKPGEPVEQRMVSTSGLTTFCARESDVRDARREFVPVTLSFVEVSEWWPWMKMGSLEGFMTWRLYGSKLRGPGELPPEFDAFVAGRKPGWLDSPGV
jgi:hypothetical protein